MFLWTSMWQYRNVYVNVFFGLLLTKSETHTTNKTDFKHLECTLSNDDNLCKDGSLWPIRFLKTIPNISLSQRGCISRNSYANAQYINIWFTQQYTKNITADIFTKLRHWTASVALLSSKDTKKSM